MPKTKVPPPRPPLDGYRARHSGAVDQHGAVADDGIVADMRVGHKHRMAADARHAAAFDGAAVDGDALADDVVISHLQPRFFPAITDVLRLNPDGAEGAEAVMRADLRRAVDRHVRDPLAVFSQLDLGADYAIMPNRARRRYLRARINDVGS